MEILEEREKCTGCGACVNSCPKGCISFKLNKDGFYYPVVNDKECVLCNKCKAVCPILNEQKKHSSLTLYSAYSMDNDSILHSSSGAIFPLIAKHIIDLQGVVFGAAFSQDFTKVEHVCVQRVEDVVKLQSSKYVQSDIGLSYRLAKQFLDDGRYVLFSGTPCQIAGLYSYLGNKEYERLFTQDIICFGIPSPFVWEKYVKEIKSKYGDISYVNFRDKSTCWQDSCVKIGNYVAKKSEDYYMKSFLERYNVRESCFNCKFRDRHRISDITLADFWGIEEVSPRMYNKNGTSMIFVHSNKGEILFNAIKDKIVSNIEDADNSLRNNIRIEKNMDPNIDREEFLKHIKKYSVEKSYKLCNKEKRQSIIEKIKIKAKGMFGR